MLFTEFRDFALLWSALVVDEGNSIDFFNESEHLKIESNIKQDTLLKSREEENLLTPPILFPSYPMYEIYYDRSIEFPEFKNDQLDTLLHKYLTQIEKEIPYYSCRSDDYVPIYNKKTKKLERLHVKGKPSAEIFKDLLLADKLELNMDLPKVSINLINNFIDFNDFMALGSLERTIRYAIEQGEWSIAYSLGAFKKETWLKEASTDLTFSVNPFDIETIAYQLLYCTYCSDYTLYLLSEDFRPFKTFQRYLFNKIDFLTKDIYHKEEFGKIINLPNGLHLLNPNVALSILINFETPLSKHLRTRFKDYLTATPLF